MNFIIDNYIAITAVGGFLLGFTSLVWQAVVAIRNRIRLDIYNVHLSYSYDESFNGLNIANISFILINHSPRTLNLINFTLYNPVTRDMSPLNMRREIDDPLVTILASQSARLSLTGIVDKPTNDNCIFSFSINGKKKFKKVITPVKQ